MKFIVFVAILVSSSAFAQDKAKPAPPAKLDPIKAVKADRDLARVAQLRAEAEAAAQPYLLELQGFCKELGLVLDDLLVGRVRINPDTGEVVRPMPPKGRN